MTASAVPLAPGQHLPWINPSRTRIVELVRTDSGQTWTVGVYTTNMRLLDDELLTFGNEDDARNAARMIAVTLTQLDRLEVTNG